MIFNKKGVILAISGIMIALSFLFKIFDWNLAASGLLLAATIIAGYSIARKAFHLLLMKIISIELLVTIAVLGAMVIHEYIESAAVTFLFLLGAYLEGKTLERTRASIKEVLDLAPLEARVIREGKKEMISSDKLVEGDLVIVQSGEKIPVDGHVLSGNGYMLEAPITGESALVKKEKDGKVYCGTILDHGYLEIMADRVGEDTTYAKIIELVEEAQESKAKTQQFLERFASYYTPGILVLSGFVFLLTKDISLTLTFLVIACPGALVISAPVSIVAGIGNGARKGILIKGGEIFEKFAKADIIAFDKTGTLTNGNPQVVDIETSDISETELLRITALAEQYSEHPLGRTIVKEAEERKLCLDGKLENFHVEKGKGIEAIINNSRIVVGNQKWMKEKGIDLPSIMEHEAHQKERDGKTVVFVGVNESYKGTISIMDTIRTEAYQTILDLRESGIKEMVMLTGDNTRTAEKISQLLGLDRYEAELLPEDKVEMMKKLQRNKQSVIMVGDGINDAPAIATATIGIAMGATGSAAAMETADVVLMSNHLRSLKYAHELSKATMKNMKQNMFMSISVVLLLLIGVLTKTVFLAEGMFVHEFSVLLVIINAIRLVKFDYNFDKRSKEYFQTMREERL
ncbi:heavy metal translocating P-type ATPase [Cytobacillus sp. Hz8]|uniref:heavy metal translocating P-type ATPase n=1 Tax=Cytobacillus sp. Hz8 TaxID=3347168 RepID=UPI0035D552E7